MCSYCRHAGAGNVRRHYGFDSQGSRVHVEEEGIKDIIYAVGIAPQKLTRIALLNSRGANVKIILDNLASAMAVSEFCRTHNTKIGVLLEMTATATVPV